MNSPSREEIDAKLDTVEARLEGRVAAIQASIDGLVARLDERSRRTDERIQRNDERFDERARRNDEQLEEYKRRTDERVTHVEKLFDETRAAISNLKTTMLVTAISSVLAIILGVGAINASLLSSVVAAFEAGGNLSATQAEVRRQVEETAALVKQLQARTPPAAGQAQPPTAPANPKQP